MSGKVLLIEDDRLLLNVLRDKLIAAGVDVSTADDGVVGLAMLEDEQFDLIALDLVMPHMDGFAFLELLRKDERWREVPVLVTSNLGQENEVERALELGASDFAIKATIEVKELVEKIISMLKEKHESHSDR